MALLHAGQASVRVEQGQHRERGIATACFGVAVGPEGWQRCIFKIRSG
jgi:hypothetical protein